MGVAGRHWRRRLAWPVMRRVILVALVLGQFVSNIGLVPLSASPVKDCSRPYPCMNRPCGCTSYDECWAGDCCCFTMAQKVAWAAANGITPPEYAQKIAAAQEAESGPTCPHCHPPAAVEKKAPQRWLAGVAVQRCRGQIAADVSAATPGLPPIKSVSWSPEWPCSGSIPNVAINGPRPSSPPLDPPPRA
jgi:hypothetical protein